MLRRRSQVLALAALSGTIAPGCLEPTEIIVTITTDISCSDDPEVGIALGPLDSLEKAPFSTTTTQCDAATGRIGSIVVIPGASRDGQLGIRVVGGLTSSPDDCQALGYEGGCVVARRIIGFLSHRILRLPIELEASCIGVPCEATETCRSGACVSANIEDLAACAAPEGCRLPDAGGSGPRASGGSASGGGASGGSGGSASGGVSSGGSASGGGASGGSGGSASGGVSSGGSTSGGGSGGTTNSLDLDETEVTREDYRAWLLTNPSTGAQLPECSWNTSFTPGCDYPPASGDRHPVTCVDWCDAYAYCLENGRRLCGKIGGGPNNFGDYANPVASQWYYACTSGGVDPFPYGSTYSGAKCNGVDAGNGMSVEVGTMTNCHSSNATYSPYVDLSGNVFEWEDSCQASVDESDGCRIRGGGYGSGQSDLRCDLDAFAARGYTSADLGFRCCAVGDFTPY